VHDALATGLSDLDAFAAAIVRLVS